jgi:Uma2 family endonuclease
MATRSRFGVEAYERLFRGVKNVELLEVEVYEMSPIGPRRAWKVARLVRAFLEALGDQAVAWPQNPIRIPPHSEPQPDLALLKPRDYGEALPTPEDVLLLVEVADSGLGHDQERKLPIYAQAGILEVWILDLEQNLLHAFRHPKEGVYTERRTFLPGEKAEPLAFPGVRIAWD